MLVGLVFGGFWVFNNGLIIQGGNIGMPVNGGTYTFVLPVPLNFAMIALATPHTTDIPDIVVTTYIPYVTQTTFAVVYDYETGHAYSGQGSNQLWWMIIGA